MRDHYGALRVLLRAAGGGVREGADLSPEWYKTYGYGPEHEFFPNRSAALPAGWTPTYDPSQHFGANQQGQGSTNAGAGILGTVAGLVKNGRSIKNMYDTGTKLYDRFTTDPYYRDADAIARDTGPTNDQINSDFDQMQNPADNPSYLNSGLAAGAGAAGAGALGALGASAIPAGTVAITEGAGLAGLTGGAAAGAGGAGAGAAGAGAAGGAGALGGGASADAAIGAGGSGVGGAALAAAPVAIMGAIAALGMGAAEHDSAKYLKFVDRTVKNFHDQHPTASGVGNEDYATWSPEDQKAWWDYVRSDAAKFDGWFPLIPHSTNNNSELRNISKNARGGLAQLGDHMPFNPRMGALQQMMGGPAQSRGTPSYYTYGANTPPQQPPMGPPQGLPAMAGGGAFGYAGGGGSPKAARLVKGPGTGRSDDIPARLSDGEYVFDAETVALLGDGSTDEGARRLDALRTKLRMHKGKKLAKGKFSAKAKTPESYME